MRQAMIRFRKILIKTLELSILGMFMFSSLEAEELSETKSRFNAYQEKNREFQNMPQAQSLLNELNMLSQWMTQANRALADGEDDRFVHLVNQIQVQIRLIEVSVDNLNAQELVVQKRKEAEGLENKAKHTREEVSRLEESLTPGDSRIRSSSPPTDLVRPNQPYEQKQMNAQPANQTAQQPVQPVQPVQPTQPTP
jgi:hypothetical protein